MESLNNGGIDVIFSFVFGGPAYHNSFDEYKGFALDQVIKHKLVIATSPFHFLQ